MTLVAALVGVALAAAAVRLDVPLERQAPERCGPAALRMVLGFHGADSTALAEADRAYDPALRGALITDLAAAARRAGFTAEVRALATDDLVALLARGRPPVVLYRHGAGPLGRAHYAVVVGWEPERARLVLHDGSARPRALARDAFERRWRAEGARALVVAPGAP